MLKARGSIFSKNHLHHILHNPFYSGLMASNVLNGEVVKGKHEPIISQDIFLAVNNVFRARSGTVGNCQEENDKLPLKILMKCGNYG